MTSEILISERPAEAEDRAIPGHWEGDLIVGLESSAIGTLVERTTRFTLLLDLPRMEGHGEQPLVKNGPALAGHGAEAVRDAIAETIGTLPDQLRRSLTWDQACHCGAHRGHPLAPYSEREQSICAPLKRHRPGAEAPGLHADERPLERRSGRSSWPPSCAAIG